MILLGGLEKNLVIWFILAGDAVEGGGVERGSDVLLEAKLLTWNALKHLPSFSSSSWLRAGNGNVRPVRRFLVDKEASLADLMVW